MSSAAACALDVPPVHTPGERFRCRVDIEDVCLSVEGGAAASTAGMFWEEARVACEFNGSTQRTRWLTLPSAMDEAKRDLQQHEKRAAATPQSGGLLALPYSPFNNLSYEVEFTAADDADGAGAVRTVRPKRFHLLEVRVEAQNLHRAYSASGGQTGDRAPTSGNMEAISATLNKKAAKVSAWTRSVFSKLGSSGGGGDDSKKEEAGHRGHHSQAHDSGRQQNDAALASLSNHPTTRGAAPTAAAAAAVDREVREGTYETVLKHIDLSEAYNQPGGRQRYCLVVKPSSRKVPESGSGTPVTVSFTVVAHYGLQDGAVRSFHNFAIVADQFVLDYSEAARVLPPDPKEENAPPRPIVGYAFGFTSNTAANATAMAATSKLLPVIAPSESGSGSDAPAGDGSAMRLIDFDRLHRETDERKRTAADYAELPTSCCVVSGSTGSQPANRVRVGNRVLCTSRFKTSPDGLCKPSFKCQFVITLVRYYGTRGESVREAAAPINLAALLNQESLPQRIRTVKFELGEIMYLRLRRFSFAEPEVLRAPLLTPYDYNNDDVHMPAPSPAARQPDESSPSPAHAAAHHEEAADGPQQRADPPAAVAPAAQRRTEPGMPAISFDPASSSASSSVSDEASATRCQREQRSSSDASTPRAPPHDSAAVSTPFFTLEPQEERGEEKPGDDSAMRAAVSSRDPNPAVRDGWGARPAATFEVTPTLSNPFFSALGHDHDEVQPTQYEVGKRTEGAASQRAAGAGQRPLNPYAFDSEESAAYGSAEAKATSSPAFELTPFD